MTEHDENLKNLAFEPNLGQKPRSVFRLGIACLAALMFAVLLLVVGSFSKITSTGEASGLTVKVAGFNVEVDLSNDYSPEEPYPYGDCQVVVYAFTITNYNEVDITYDMEFDITITTQCTRTNMEYIKNFKAFLFDESGYEVIDFNLGEGTGEPIGDDLYKVTNKIKYPFDDGSTEETDNDEFSQSKNGEKTYILVADYSDCVITGYYTFNFSGTITIPTINQEVSKNE